MEENGGNEFWFEDMFFLSYGGHVESDVVLEEIERILTLVYSKVFILDILFKIQLHRLRRLLQFRCLLKEF